MTEDKQTVQVEKTSVKLEDSNDKPEVVNAMKWFFLFGVFALGGGAQAFVSLNLQAYLQQELGQTMMTFNLFSTCYYVLQAIGSPILLYLSEFVGRKPVYVLSHLILVGTCLGMAQAKSVHAIFIIRGVQGFFGITQTMGSVIISEVTGPHQRVHNMIRVNSYYSAGMLGTIIINTVILPYIPASFSKDDNYILFRSSQYTGAVCYAIATISALIFRESNPATRLRKASAEQWAQYQQDPVESKRESLFTVLKQHKEQIPLLVTYLLCWGNNYLNSNAQPFIMAKYMGIRSTDESRDLTLYFSLIGVGIMLVFRVWIYRPLVHCVGHTRVHVAFIIFPLITSAIRSIAAPISNPVYTVALVFN